MKFDVSKLAFCFIATFATGFIGSIYTMQSLPVWYAGLQKPFFNPPNWIFGPVWTVLYVLMAISMYRVWVLKTKKHVEKRRALVFFLLQLCLNTFWSIIFFGFQSPEVAFVIIVGLWITILATLISFYRLDKLAGMLLVPYLAWVSFATILNYFIMKLN